MGFRRYYIDVVEDRERGFVAFLLKLVLAVAAFFYWLGVCGRNLLYDTHILRQKSSAIPVISLGNLTWGGTGKTSLAIALTRMLSPKKIAVISRGYGEDERALLKRSLAGRKAESFASADRAKLLEKIGSDYDLAILDDGFQHRTVKPAVNILLINGARPFGNGFLIPLGSLREPMSAVKRADIVLIMQERNQGLTEKLKAINPDIKLFHARYKVEGLSDVEGRAVGKAALVGTPFASFCAIGYPEGFQKSLKELGLKPALTFEYPDHHDLREDELKKMERDCQALHVDRLIITAKDRERFRFPTRLSLLVLDVCLAIEEEDAFLAALSKGIA